MDAVRIFVERIKLFCITAVPQAHHQPYLILNLSAKPDEVMPNVNETTDKEIAQESMQFG